MYLAVFIRCATAVTRCHSLPFVVTRCYSLSLVVPLIVIRCHSLYHSLSLVVPFAVTRCTTRCHSLPLDVPLVCLFINDLLIKTYCVNVVVDIETIYLNKGYLFQNKIYYLDKIYFCFAKMISKLALYKLNLVTRFVKKNIDFMQHNIKIWHVLGWPIKRCDSFLNVVPVSKTGATRYIFRK